MLLGVDQGDLLPELRLELLFYGVAYCLVRFEEAATEMQSLLDAGVRVPSVWDLARDVAAAKERGNPHAELLARVVSASDVPHPVRSRYGSSRRPEAAY